MAVGVTQNSTFSGIAFAEILRLSWHEQSNVKRIASLKSNAYEIAHQGNLLGVQRTEAFPGFREHLRPAMPREKLLSRVVVSNAVMIAGISDRRSPLARDFSSHR